MKNFCDGPNFIGCARKAVQEQELGHALLADEKQLWGLQEIGTNANPLELSEDLEVLYGKALVRHQDGD